MQGSLRRIALTIALIVTATWTGAQTAEDEPLAPQLLAAEKIFVKQTLIDPKIVSRLRSEIVKLERFEIVATAEEADLVATLSATVDYTETVADSEAADPDSLSDGSRTAGGRPRPMGTVRVLEDLYLKLTTPDGTDVWTDSVPLGSLTGNASKKLVKRLAARLEAES